MKHSNGFRRTKHHTSTTYEVTSFVMIFFNEEKVSPLTLLTVVLLVLEEILDTECEARGGMKVNYSQWMCLIFDQAAIKPFLATHGDRMHDCCNLRSGCCSIRCIRECILCENVPN